MCKNELVIHNKGVNMTDNIYTEDLSEFGYIELEEAGKLLSAIKKGLPEDFYDDEIRVGFNKNSGYVFLTNSEYQVAMLDDEGKLYSFYSTPYEGREGSYEDLLEEFDDMHPEDQEYMNDIKQFHEVA
tara:strand:+ start:29 stop:412 length:384 start_codon:yes stop_codon:yes gene_type:complete